MRKLFILVAAAALLTTAACNTVAGVGKDTQAAGKAVEDAAKDVKYEGGLRPTPGPRFRRGLRQRIAPVCVGA